MRFGNVHKTRANYPKHSLLFNVLLLALLLTVALKAMAEATNSTSLTFASTPDGCADNSPWCKTFFFGIQLLPDYGSESDGENSSFEGLQEQAFFGQFNFDAVYKPEHTWFANLFQYLRKNKSSLDNFGLSVNLYESGAVVENQTPSGDQNAAPGTPATQSNTASAVPNSFNQITGTVGIEAYRSFNWFGNQVVNATGNPIGSGSAYGPKILIGTRTRDSSAKNEDTLSSYGTVGFNYAFYKQLPTLQKNSIPAGELFFGFGWYEEWAGKKIRFKDLDEEARLIFRGTYNISNQWFLGVYANGGKGPDEISIFFGTRRTTEELLAFLGLGSP